MFRKEAVRRHDPNKLIVLIVPDGHDITHGPGWRKIDGKQLCVVGGRPQNLSVEHSRSRDVRWIFVRASDKVTRGRPRYGGPEHPPFPQRRQRHVCWNGLLKKLCSSRAPGEVSVVE